MKRKIISLVLSLLLITFLQSLTTANAEDSWFADDAAPFGKLGLVWVEDVLGGNGLTNAINYQTSTICSSLDDANCQSGNVYVDIMLPPCSSTLLESCVEGLEVGQKIGNSSVMTAGKLFRTIDGDKFPASQKFGVPAGGTTGIWTVPGQKNSAGNELYSVAARIQYQIINGITTLYGFQSSVVPIRIKDSQSAQRMQMAIVKDGPNSVIVHEYHVGDCVWQEVGKCAVAVRWSKDSIATLKLRVPNQVTGWLYGRLSHPSISVNPIDSKQNSLTISASPITVQGSKPLVDVNAIPQPLLDVLTSHGSNPLRTYGNYANGGYVWQIPTDTSDFSWFEQWKPFTKDKADALLDYWNLKSVPNNNSMGANCLKKSNELVGLVTSNSLWYTGQAPTFDGSNLNYEVASLHYNPDGKSPFLGTYDLVMRSDAARCLYGFNSAPVSAKISIVSADGAPQVATSVLSENNGWLSLSASNFTFSSPKIQVQLSQSAEASNAVIESSSQAKPLENSVGSNKQTDIINQGQADSLKQKKLKIVCQKGKTRKIATGLKPKCPVGYNVVK